MTVVNDAEILWNKTRESLAGQVSDAVWISLFSDSQGLYLDENCLTVQVSSDFVRDRIEQRYRDLIISTVDDVSQLNLALELRVGQSSTDSEDLEVDLSSITRDAIGSPENVVVPQRSQPTITAHHNDPPSTGRSSKLNSKYTFASFVTGPSNRFAQAAALSVAETPARSYNPLFVYGDAGLGKTHLLQAIAHYVAENYPKYVTRYISTETILNEFIDAIRNNAQQDFKRRYREVDILLVDDVQFLEGKEQLQEEFFHTFNHLHEANRQIVLSSDRSPDAVATLQERLRSRFKMGLVTDIQPPDFETRLAILRKKAGSREDKIPESVLEFIVEHVTNNIRELEGALNRITAYALLNQRVVSLEDAEVILSDIVQKNEPRRITPQVILEETSEMFDFTIEELKAHDRRRPLVNARQIGMYVFRELTDLSYPQIAENFGGRDHTTVIYAYDKISALMQEKQAVYDDVTALITQIKGGRD